MNAMWYFCIGACAFYLLVTIVEKIVNKKKRKGNNNGRDYTNNSGTDDTGTSGQNN